MQTERGRERKGESPWIDKAVEAGHSESGRGTQARPSKRFGVDTDPR
jgi:hypothetical protein